MRIGFGWILHETNTFSNVKTTLASFKEYHYLEGEAVMQAWRGVRSYVGGLIDEAESLGIELVPTFTAVAKPSGTITKECLETLRDTLVANLEALHARKPLDGIALILHGAGTAEEYPDIEGEILRRVRGAFGPDMPIGVVLDLHGNITDTMMAHADILVGIQEYPHVDSYETTRRMLGHLHAMIQSGEKPCMRLIKLPWVFPGTVGMTVSGHARDIKAFCRKIQGENPDLLQASFFHGFPYADVPHAGVAVTTLAKTQEAADRCAQAIAEYAWSRRGDMVAKAVSPAEAFDAALALGVRPIVINESSDNPGGGAPGDGTHLLREMLRRNLPDTAFGYITDPEVVQQAIHAGVGATLSCRLGGKTDDLHGAPVVLENAYVKAISDGRHIKVSPMGKGAVMDMGNTVLLKVGNVQIIVGSKAAQTMDKGPFRMMGIDYRSMHILALKSAQHFRGWWQDHAAAICPCDPPGLGCGDLSQFRFEHVNQGFYPFDPACQWP